MLPDCTATQAHAYSPSSCLEIYTHRTKKSNDDRAQSTCSVSAYVKNNFMDFLSPDEAQTSETESAMVLDTLSKTSTLCLLYCMCEGDAATCITVLGQQNENQLPCI